jgi:hypothetical protein
MRRRSENSEVLAPEERVECAEMLEFVAGLLKAEPFLTKVALRRFSPGYELHELRSALAHFARRIMETTS